MRVIMISYVINTRGKDLQVAFPSLETLYLRQCVLEDIAMIGELRNLEILDLRYSNVEQLPRETLFPYTTLFRSQKFN